MITGGAQLFGPGDVLAVSQEAAQKIAAHEGRFDRDSLEAAFGNATARAQQLGDRRSVHIGVVPIVGLLARGFDYWGLGTSTEAVRSKVRDLTRDREIDALLLYVDSPGGEVDGTEEAAMEVRAARYVKPVIALAYGTAASAAYWIASQASRLLVAVSGEVGSIGVYGLHQDVSRALDSLGVKMTIVSSSPEKVEANSYEPLSADARTHMQRHVNHYAAMFRESVARGRGVPVSRVESSFGRGRMFVATDARSAGVVDEIATFEQALAITYEAGAERRAAGRRQLVDAHVRLLELQAEDPGTIALYAAQRDRRRLVNEALLQAYRDSADL